MKPLKLSKLRCRYSTQWTTFRNADASQEKLLKISSFNVVMYKRNIVKTYIQCNFSNAIRYVNITIGLKITFLIQIPTKKVYIENLFF